jgi:hypothetical protein
MEHNNNNDRHASPVVVSTSTLSNHFQTSSLHIRQALSQIANVVVVSTTPATATAAVAAVAEEEEHVHNDEVWQLVAEEEILYGQKALVQLLCEEQDAIIENMPLQEMAQSISERLLPLLMEQHPPPPPPPPSTANTSPAISNSNTTEQRSLAIAEKTIWMARKELPKKTNAQDIFSEFRTKIVPVDPSKVCETMVASMGH